MALAAGALVPGHIKVCAGRMLRPTTWPTSVQVAVAFSLEVENETTTLRDDTTSPALLAQTDWLSSPCIPI
jgi:hypothetical protein